MTAPDAAGTEPDDDAAEQDRSAGRPVLTTDDEAQTDDPVIDPENS